jgi:hypothetical protein
MSIDKINFSYPKGSMQSVFDTEAMTALELASKTSKKVDECVELVNGVEQSAIEATAVVDEMRLVQEQFVIDNNDTRDNLIIDNQDYIKTLEASKVTFDSNMISALNNTKNSMDIALGDYKTNSTTQLNTFTTELNIAKNTFVNEANQIITNSTQLIKDNVKETIVVMTTDGSISEIINDELFTAINTDITKNKVVVSDTEPLNAEMWYDSVGETSIEINGEMVILQEI